MSLRVKSLEDEVLDGDGDMDGSDVNRSSVRKPGPINYADDMFGNSGDEDAVNIGDR